MSKSISVVIPVFNEEKNLELLYNELMEVLRKLGVKYEIIFVDDGSTDSSFDILEKIFQKDKHAKVIKFRKNFGQTAALNAGFQAAKNDIIISIDADLQNNPDDIPALLKKIEEGHDVVSGWRYKREDSFFSKKLPSAFSNWLARKLTGLDIHDSGCTLKAYKREALKNITLYGEMHRYIPAILNSRGYKIAEVKVEHRQRKFGKTKYNFTRLLKGLLDLIYIKFWSGYSTKPLHFFGLIGFFQYFLAILILAEQISMMLLVWKTLVVGPLLLLAVVFFITGTLFVMFGFLGEILVRTYYAGSAESPHSIEKVLEK